MNAHFSIASTALTMQAEQEARFAYGLVDAGQLAARFVQLQQDRLRLTLNAALAYLQDCGYRDDADVRSVLLLDALDAFRKYLRVSGIPAECAGQVEACFTQFLRESGATS